MWWFQRVIGSLSNDDGDVNKNGKKAIGLDWQNNNFACASRLFVHFFAFTAQLRLENAYFHDLSRTGTQDNLFPFLFLNFDTAAQIHFLSDVFVAVAGVVA